MIKSTKIIAVDSKGGRRSRTGSFVSMGVTDREAIECQDYFLDLADGEEPTGRVKKIELVIYYEDDLSTNDPESKVDEMTLELETAIKEDTPSSNGQPIKTLEDVIIEQDEEDDVIISETCKCIMGEAIDGICVACGLKFVEKEKLPANQGDLPLYGKKYDDDGNIICKSQVL